MMTELEAQRLHSEAKTELEKAKIELQTWIDFGTKARAEKVVRSLFLQEFFQTPRYEIEMRLQLLGMGEWTALLWVRVDDVMPLKTAVELARKARNRAAFKKEEHQVSVEKILEQYDALPLVMSVGKGRLVRKPHYHHKPPPEKSKRSEKKAAPPAEPDFRTAIRAATRKFVEEKIPSDADELAVQTEVQRFETDLMVLLEYFTSRLYDIGRRESLAQVFSRKKFAGACQVLRVAPPKETNIDEAFLKKTKRLFKELARQYHPDMTRTESTRDQFDAVMEAWRIVESYSLSSIKQRKEKHGNS
jgi:hypothetical protein